jgi:hypothetical protein
VKRNWISKVKHVLVEMLRGLRGHFGRVYLEGMANPKTRAMDASSHSPDCSPTMEPYGTLKMNGTEKMMKDDTQIKKEMMILMFSVWTPGWILGV